MSLDLLLNVAVGLLPVLAFLATLLYLDSYKLVRVRVVIAIVASGVVVAYVCYAVNALLLDATAMDFTRFSRYADASDATGASSPGTV